MKKVRDAFLPLLRWTGTLGFEYFWDTVRGLTGTPPTPLNVAVLCHLTAVPIFLPYSGWEARWKQKGRQEYFNIALRSHTICPFHEQADGRVGNKSLHYKQTPSYFRVTCKSRHLTGPSQCKGTRYCEFASSWKAPNDCTALYMYSLTGSACLWLLFYNEMIFSVTFSVGGNSLFIDIASFSFYWLYLWKEKEKAGVFMRDCHGNRISHMTCKTYPNIFVKFVVPQLPRPSAFIKCCLWGLMDLVLDMQVILGSAEAVHYPPVKPRPEGPPGPCPFIQTGHLTLLPSHDYQGPFCRQCSCTERTWWDSGTQLPVIIHHLPQLSTGPDLTLTKTQTLRCRPQTCKTCKDEQK